MPYKDPQVRREKAKEYSKKHYQSNRAQCIARVKENKRIARQNFLEFKSRLSCVKCGQNHPATLDFHHVVRHPSNKKIYELTQNGAYDAAMKEITEKCIVLCSNCHRVHHWEEQKGLPEQCHTPVESD